MHDGATRDSLGENREERSTAASVQKILVIVHALWKETKKKKRENPCVRECTSTQLRKCENARTRFASHPAILRRIKGPRYGIPGTSAEIFSCWERREEKRFSFSPPPGNVRSGREVSVSRVSVIQFCFLFLSFFPFYRDDHEFSRDRVINYTHGAIACTYRRISSSLARIST